MPESLQCHSQYQLHPEDGAIHESKRISSSNWVCILAASHTVGENRDFPPQSLNRSPKLPAGCLSYDPIPGAKGIPCFQ